MLAWELVCVHSFRSTFKTDTHDIRLQGDLRNLAFTAKQCLSVIFRQRSKFCYPKWGKNAFQHQRFGRFTNHFSCQDFHGGEAEGCGRYCCCCNSVEIAAGGNVANLQKATTLTSAYKMKGCWMWFGVGWGSGWEWREPRALVFCLSHTITTEVVIVKLDDDDVNDNMMAMMTFAMSSSFVVGWLGDWLVDWLVDCLSG